MPGAGQNPSRQDRHRPGLHRCSQDTRVSSHFLQFTIHSLVVYYLSVSRWLPVVLTILGAGAWSYAQRPAFKQTPEVPALPKALMKLPRTNITRAKYPAVDFHFHGRGLATAEDYRKTI